MKPPAKGLSKEEVSRRLNDVLEIKPEIDFTKLSKEELDRLVVTLSDPRKLLRIAGTGTTQRGLERLRAAVDEVLSERKGGLFGLGLLPEGKSGEEDKGPLGLGVLPRVRQRLER